jgi:hypothetical protein
MNFTGEGVLNVSNGKKEGQLYVDLLILGGKVSLRGGGITLKDHGKRVSVEGTVESSKFGPLFRVGAWAEL